MRTRLIMTCVYALREAENIYLEKLDATMKQQIYKIINELKFTDKERSLLEYELYNLGV
jgi:hypothetical protein